MEDLMMIKRNQTRMSPSSTPSPPLSINRDSNKISKPKPKIRIIHIFAPEIIKTDVANFRELVQRLTGKPPQDKGCSNKPKTCRKDRSFRDEKPKMELMRTGFIQGLVKEEEEEEGMWGTGINGENNSSGFLSGLGDLDGFIQELGEFPLLPLDHMHGFEEAQFA